MSSLPDDFSVALRFAAGAHGDQKMLSGLPYTVHLSCVAMEVAHALHVEPGRNGELAIVCALLHDVVEDTPTSVDEVEKAFGAAVAKGVAALTKNASLPAGLQMRDSLNRILEQPPEIAMVKLADRIINLASPPPGWTPERVSQYRDEAEEILSALGDASATLAGRLRARIAAYGPIGQ